MPQGVPGVSQDVADALQDVAGVSQGVSANPVDVPDPSRNMSDVLVAAINAWLSVSARDGAFCASS